MTTADRTRWAAARLTGGALAVAGAAWVTGAVFGFRGPAFAWVTHCALMAWMSAVMTVTRPALRGGWFQVRAGEPAVYRRLGVVLFLRLLRRIGWERAQRGTRSFDGTRSALTGLERDTRRSELAHLVLAAIGTVLVAVAVAFAAWDAAAWLLAVNILLHGYPVLLQRWVRARVTRIARSVEAADEGFPPA